MANHPVQLHNKCYFQPVGREAKITEALVGKAAHLEVVVNDKDVDPSAKVRNRANELVVHSMDFVLSRVRTSIRQEPPAGRHASPEEQSFRTDYLMCFQAGCYVKIRVANSVTCS